MRLPRASPSSLGSGPGRIRRRAACAASFAPGSRIAWAVANGTEPMSPQAKTPRAQRRGGRQRPARQARRLALLALFEEEFRPRQAVEALDRLAEEQGASRGTAEHARGIVRG